MRAALFRLTLLGLASASLLSACADFDSGEVIQPTDSGRVIRSKSGALTPPTTAFEKTAREFMADHGVNAAQLTATHQYTTARGATHVKFEQVVDGLRVYNAYVRASFDAQGQLVQVIDGSRVVSGGLKAPAISDSAALEAAKASLGYAINDAFYRAPSVEEVIYVDANGVAKRGYVIETWALQGNQLNYTLVSGKGEVVSTELRTQNDSYNVFTEDPLKGGQTVVNGPGAGNAESPAGWLTGTSQNTNNITGNNAHAYLDTDANNLPDSGGSASGSDFLTAANLGQTPTTTANKAVAVQNLFYLNNVVHDTLYKHGFNELAGNFQNNNFGKGGLGNDAVNAEAQDGSGTDNANFSTPADGSAPRMQMYLWTGAAPTDYAVVNGTNYGAYHSSFGPAATTAGITGPLALASDATGSATDGCETQRVSLTGKIAIVDRGTCDFTVKVLNAQNAGAIGVIIVNNSPDGAFAPGGTSRKVTIQSAMVTQADGATLKGLVGASANLKKSNLVALQIDGDIDADVVFHEYGHGLTWRMIGQMSGVFAGAIGEGASDVNAFLINGDDRIGEYAYSNPVGIRRYPYANYPLTYANWTSGEVHSDGEIYAAAMWRVKENYLAAGLTVSDVQDDFVDGMNYTPASPKPENMRDGMLQAVGAGSPRACLIWRGFADTGIGVGATGTARGGRAVVTESFAKPSGC